MNVASKAVFFATLALALAAPMSTASAGNRFPDRHQDQDSRFLHHHANALVDAVREATAKYRDVSQAVKDGYGPVFGCVSSPGKGVMGVHYIKPELLADFAADAARPEALVYEPTRYGMRLVAVEYLIDAALWNDNHTDGAMPILMGQAFFFTGKPNRFRAESYYSLHVWAWKYNPNGTFTMWNPRASCDDYNG